jgi:hypothetical protein
MNIHFLPNESVDRVRRILCTYACGHLHVRCERGHLLIGPAGADAISRITAYGENAFGLAFREPDGSWSPVLVVGSLDTVIAGVTASIDAEEVLATLSA